MAAQTVTQATLETWEMKMTRLALELKALRAEYECAPADDPRWRKWSPRHRALSYAIECHVSRVP